LNISPFREGQEHATRDQRPFGEGHASYPKARSPNSHPCRTYLSSGNFVPGWGSPEARGYGLSLRLKRAQRAEASVPRSRITKGWSNEFHSGSEMG
jgi:hypothetical protein